MNNPRKMRRIASCIYEKPSHASVPLEGKIGSPRMHDADKTRRFAICAGFTVQDVVDRFCLTFGWCIN